MAKKDDLKNKICDFFLKNQNPSDKVVHNWAEKNGYKFEDVEKEIYKLTTRFVNLCKGGLSKGEEPKDLDPKELKMGIGVEREHVVGDDDVVRKIALDHLTEHKTYYTALKEMEKKLEESKKEASMRDAILKLTFVANDLDGKGFKKEADRVDKVIEAALWRTKDVSISSSIVEDNLKVAREAVEKAADTLSTYAGGEKKIPTSDARILIRQSIDDAIRALVQADHHLGKKNVG